MSLDQLITMPSLGNRMCRKKNYSTVFTGYTDMYCIVASPINDIIFLLFNRSFFYSISMADITTFPYAFHPLEQKVKKRMICL